MSWDEIWPLVIAVVAAAIGLLLVEVLYRVLRGLTRLVWRCGDPTAATPPTGGGRKQRARIAAGLFTERLVEHLYRPAQLMTATLGAWTPIAAISVSDDDWDALRRGLEIGMIIAGVWVSVVLLLWGLTEVGGRFAFGGSDTARRFRSQADTIGRIFAIVVVLAVAVLALITVDQVRSLGTTVLAGAGLIGAIAGLAAQKTLANVFAGIAIGFNNTLNLGDVVEVDGESGEVVQRTLTYVVLKLSDQRQLVLPTSTLLDKSHRNWRLTRHRVVGWVPLDVDWTVPVPKLEQALKDYIEDERPGDEERVRVEVIGAIGARVQVRAMVIDTPDDLWGLQCAVRRHLIEWLRAHYPEAIPRLRADVTLPTSPPATTGTSGGSSSGSGGGSTDAGTGRVATGRQAASASRRKDKEKVPTDQ